MESVKKREIPTFITEQIGYVACAVGHSMFCRILVMFKNSILLRTVLVRCIVVGRNLSLLHVSSTFDKLK